MPTRYSIFNTLFSGGSILIGRPVFLFYRCEMIKTGSVYGLSPERSSGEGVRLLVSRYWPRGVKKEVVDMWLKGLGTEPGLIAQWKSKSIGWKEFSLSYIEGLNSTESVKALTTLREVIKEAGNTSVTLLCTCEEGQMCHRELLKEFIERA